MLDNFQYQSMTAESRALLPMLWLLACEDKDPTSGLVKLSLDEISFRLRLHVKTLSKCIDELQVADFIECVESVTKPLRGRNQSVTPETETETETETDKGRRSIPYQEILNLYHGILTNNPKVVIYSDERKKKVKKLYNYHDNHKAIEWWENYFNLINESHFLTGKVEGNGRKPFSADFDWILNINNFVKITEGKYHE